MVEEFFDLSEFEFGSVFHPLLFHEIVVFLAKTTASFVSIHAIETY